MTVQPSVAQAAMIGNPVSFPKVRKLVEEHFDDRFMVVDLTEQEIIEGMLLANRHGHVVCTQGGESVAGLRKALAQGLVSKDQNVVVDSTSHQLKFANFQESYFQDAFDPAYKIEPRPHLQNRPVKLSASAQEIAEYLQLKKK
ncbi:MAG: hypothetical protein GY868_13925 [Deltaproteobacteria bacterium]|nr:hypothetical protein [Deltaproteobacteria bacterium]